MVEAEGLSLKSRVLAFVRGRDHVSFVELANAFPEFRDGEMAPMAGENIVFWQGLKEDGAAALSALRREGLVVIVPAQVLSYVIDGRMLKLPIAKQARAYKTLHWLPAVVRPIEACSPKLRKWVGEAKARWDATGVPR